MPDSNFGPVVLPEIKQ